ncbi:hypothetical protein CBR61_04625 [Porphyrobacter sp. CACIAM 03H1]|nr:hypothetical protein CBR61_04625 [Porphyrobacter sp. CACIAM 03H1]
MRILSRFDRSKIEAFAEISVALLDLLDGDADEETCATEDDFTPMPAEIDFGPGCSISDPGEVDDEPEEDDPQGECSEDEISTSLENRAWCEGPGCPIADPAEGLGQEWLP